MSTDLRELVKEHHPFYEVLPYYLIVQENPGRITRQDALNYKRSRRTFHIRSATLARRRLFRFLHGWFSAAQVTPKWKR